MGCYGSHAFRHSQNKFFGGTHFWSMTEAPMSNSTPMETCSRVAR